MSAQAPPVSAVRAQKLTRYVAQKLISEHANGSRSANDVSLDVQAGPFEVCLAGEVDRVLAERDATDVTEYMKALTFIAELKLTNAVLEQETRALREALDTVRKANQTTLSTLADIGYSDDMTLAVARKKAKRVYQGVANALVELASPGAQKET